MRTWSIVFALGLFVAWIVGLGSADSAGWMTWLTGAAAVAGFVVAGCVSPRMRRSVAVGSPIALSIGLYSLWVIGLSSTAALWQSWWAFAFACGYLLIGLSGLNPARATAPEQTEQAGESTNVSRLPTAASQNERDRNRRIA